MLSPDLACATVAHPERARALSEKLNVCVGTDNVSAIGDASIILVCVKPQVVQEVMQEISAHVSPDQLVISVAASVPTALIEKSFSSGIPVVRAMPNTPCAVGYGMTALCKGKFAEQRHLDSAAALFGMVGRTVVVDEKHMDAVTGLSASGPAYIYIILESLAEAGVKVGLPRDVATLWPHKRRWAQQRWYSRQGITLHCSRTPSLPRPAARSTASWSWKKASFG